MKLVSIIIPCYNGAAVIDQSIESVYIQDHPHIELIVVDDGSTDNSRETILAWESRFARKGAVLKYVYQENRGLGGAIDTGLKYVTGTYLTLLDADDHYLPGSVSKKAQYLDAHPECVGVRSNGWMVQGEKRELFIVSEEEKQITDLFDALSRGITNNWAGSYMVRTGELFDFYPDRTIYPSRFGQNFQILLPLAYRRRFGYIDEPLMAYIIHPNSHSQASAAGEQYHRSNVNARGYRDIYMHMLPQIVSDPEERRRYQNHYDAMFHRHMLQRGQAMGDTDQVTASFRELRRTGHATIHDRISYLAAIRSPAIYVLKLIRRISTLIQPHSTGR